jgi:DNA-binding NarL/FixJ family response regulator
LALKIVLVDDQPVPGLTLRRWLKKQRDLEVVGEAVPGSPVLALIPLVEPDVVLLDVLTSPDAGLNVARLIRDHYPNVPIVAIGAATAGSLRVEAAEAGAWAFFPKTRPEDLAKAIPSVIEGKGRRFLDLTERTFQRPASDTFVAHQDEKPRRGGAEPVTVEVAPSATAAPKRASIAASIIAAPAAAPKARTAVPRVTPAAAPKAPTTASPRTAAKAVPPSPASEKPRRARPRPAATAPQSTFELRPEPRSGSPRDAVAWTHSALEPVFESPPRKKARRRRGKEDQAPAELDVRGPTGLPRRFGGHH